MDKSDVEKSYPNMRSLSDEEVKAMIEEHIEANKRKSLFE